MAARKNVHADPPEVPITDWRRNELSDIDEIQHLITPLTINIFGSINLPLMLEKSCLSISQINANGKIVSHISLFNYPNIPCIDPSIWPEWIKKIYRVGNLSPKNSIFVHLLVWDPEYEYFFLKDLMHVIYLEWMSVQNIIFVYPPKIKKCRLLSENMIHVMPKIDNRCNAQSLYVCLRQHHIPKPKVRLALEEDHDDLVPIVDKQTEKLRTLYGEYYMAEMIGKQSEENKAVVAEVLSRAVAVMCLTTNVNIGILKEHFDLVPFFGLVKGIDGNSTPIVPTISVKQKDSKKKNYLCTITENETKMLYQDVDPIELIYSKPSLKLLRQLNKYHRVAFQDTLASLVSVNALSPFRPPDEGSSTKPTPKYKQTIGSTVCLGDPNVFCVQLFAMSEDYDERLSLYLLEGAFECFPDLDYCIILVPTDYPSFTMQKYFVRVIPKPQRTFPHDIYVAHRCSILSGITVRHAVFLDVASVEQLLIGIEDNDKIRSDFLLGVPEDNDYCYQSFVALCEKKVVGIAVVSEEENFTYIRTHYETDRFMFPPLLQFGEHGYIQHFILSPIFQRAVTFFFMEISRLSGYFHYYYSLYPQYVKPKGTKRKSLMTALDDMIPLVPRKQITYYPENGMENWPKKEVMESQGPFALYYMNLKLCSEPKLQINARIVVVGASTTALSFLEALTINPSMIPGHYKNITLVSPHGFPGEEGPHPLRDIVMPYRGCFSVEHMSHLSLQTWINVVYGVMTGINRSERFIVINGYMVLKYDYLLLFCGEQFQYPQEQPMMPPETYSSEMKRKYISECQDFPTNVFIINTEVDATDCIVKLKSYNYSEANPVVVYGHCLEAYSCVAMLLEMEIPPKAICFVDPFSRGEQVSCFNNCEIDEMITKIMKKTGIIYETEFHYANWELDEENKTVQKIIFENKKDILIKECCAFICYTEKKVSRLNFLAINKACLVYDGRLVIDPWFKTNDPYIFAAGPLTKYPRRYYADDYKHCYYNSYEIGKAVAQEVRRLFDISTTDIKLYHDLPKKMVPIYRKPQVWYYNLPLNLKYLKISKPGIEVPLEVAMIHEDFGHVMVTGKGSLEHPGYFRMHINSHGTVETITCLTGQKIDVGNMICLYGKHEKILNDMCNRFHIGYIDDFFDYFRESWCTAVFHDRFDEFHKSNLELFANQEISEGVLLYSELNAVLEKSTRKKFGPEEHKKCEKLIRNSKVISKIEEHFLKYLHDNVLHLPMYMQPDKMKEITAKFGKSPLYDEPEF